MTEATTRLGLRSECATHNRSTPLTSSPYASEAESPMNAILAVVVFLLVPVLALTAFMALNSDDE